MRNKQSLVIYLLSVPTIFSATQSPLLADCVEVQQGQVVKVEVQTCEAIVAENNKEVQKYAGPLFETWNLKKAYTGALIIDSTGALWMYSSEAKNPCNEFPKKKIFEKKAYSTCCDTGRWGKCVFGGRWLGDIDAKPINTFQ